MSKPTPGSKNLTNPVMKHDTTSRPTEQKPQTSTEQNEVPIHDSTNN